MSCAPSLVVVLTLSLAPVQLLVAHDLVFELELEFQQFDLLLVFLDLVLQVTDLALLGAVT